MERRYNAYTGAILGRLLADVVYREHKGASGEKLYNVRQSPFLTELWANYEFTTGTAGSSSSSGPSYTTRSQSRKAELKPLARMVFYARDTTPLHYVSDLALSHNNLTLRKANLIVGFALSNLINTRQSPKIIGQEIRNLLTIWTFRQ